MIRLKEGLGKVAQPEDLIYLSYFGVVRRNSQA
jgi:hypothetical protein